MVVHRGQPQEVERGVRGDQFRTRGLRRAPSCMDRRGPRRNVMIGIDDDKIVYVPFAKAIKNDKPIDRELVNVLHELSI